MSKLNSETNNLNGKVQLSPSPTFCGLCKTIVTAGGVLKGSTVDIVCGFIHQ